MKQHYKVLVETYRILKMIYKLDRSLIPTVLLSSFMLSFDPFILIVGGAIVLDSLLIRNWYLGLIQTAIMLSLSLVFGILNVLLERHVEVASMKINRLCNMEVCLKAISLDYETFEDKKSLEEFEAADYTVQRNGGFGAFIIEFVKAMQGLFGFLIASVFLVMLCMDSVKYTGRLALLVERNTSFIVVGVIVILLIMIYTKVSNFVNDKNLKLFYDGIDIEQKQIYLDRQIISNATYAKEIRMYAMSDILYHEWKIAVFKRNELLKQRWKFETFSIRMYSAINDVILLLSYLFVILKTIAGAVSIGSFTRYVGSIQQMNANLKLLIESIGRMKLFVSYLTFYVDFCEKKNKMDTGSLPVEKRNDYEYEIEFHNVSFKYPRTQQYILRNVSMKLNMKNRFALVGRNGAGKTTFIKLLCRMYDVSEGSITLNGVDIRKYNYKEYMNLFAAVFQDFSLFSFTIKDNIICSSTFDKERLWKSLDSVALSDRIKHMEKEIDTLLYHRMGDGVDLSGGEAQKLAIARALYKDAPFVILDEPTAALDPISEYEIYSHFNEMVEDKTSIYISHRMSSCRFCDDILVLDQGRLIQRGSHEELMENLGGVYAKLWNAQAKYYANDKDMQVIKAHSL